MKKLAVLCVCGLTVLQLGLEVYLRYKLVFWEVGGISAQVCSINDGHEKGIIATKEKKDSYYEFLEVKDYVINKYGNNRAILFLSDNTWYYLVFENYTNSAYSAWLSGVNEASFARLEEYYRMNPGKIPELIYVESEYTDYIESFKEKYSFKEDTLENGSVVLSDLSVK